MACRIGAPIEHLAHGYQERVSSPIFSTAIGLMIRGLQDVEAGRAPAPTPKTEAQTGEKREPSNVAEEKSPGWLENMFRRTKEWFEAEPDMDFNKKS